MIKNNIFRIRAIYDLVGPMVTTLLGVTVVVGILIGLVEVATASILYSVLVEFDLVAASATSRLQPFGLSPIAALLIFSSLTAVLRFMGQFLPALSSHEFNRRLREALVHNVLGGVVERYVMSVADVSHLLSSVIQKSSDFVFSIASVAVAVCLFMLILFGLFYTSWQMTLVALTFTALIGIPLIGLRRLYGQYVDTLHVRSRQFSNTFLRDTRNSHLLRILGANDHEIERLISISRKYISSLRHYYFWFSLSSNLPAFAWAFLVVGLLSFNAKMQFLSAEGLLPLVYLLTRLGGSVGGLSTSFGQLQQNRPYIAELARLLPMLFPKEEVSVSGGDVPPELFPLQLSKLSVGRDEPLVEPIDLSVGEGEMVLISGPSGRGKTTLIMTLIGLLQPLGGEVRWSGVPIASINPAQLRRRIGYAGMEPYLIDADIRTNLLFGLESELVSDRDIEQALTVACADFVGDLDGGLAHVLREGGEGISTGQKQRLSLARCLLRKPDVLLLDEATTNIDEATEAVIMTRVRESFPKLMIIAVSHRASLRQFAHAVLEI